ncbi:hypothetical protein O6H91_09G043200 [Diphasiastrum complanatum]|uniref:Uncharacterized protein n=1 Tax=Diphasiastrum complanatum TaxID=34168 RepID=A0ACC2CNJ6_DIPCM|nr:hypothetical protein O6H91_Y054900 [Diphasiastrum complanatum]KAJ7543559.1 hypothetical protein O6H91_09G043200 [Diphasiastrum complanatum]
MRMKSEDPDNHNTQGVYLLGSSMHDKNGYSQALEGIREDSSTYLPSPSSYPPPETPQEPMEFLSRTWKISAVDVAKALAPGQVNDTRKLARCTGQSSELSGVLETAPFTFASAMTSKMVMDRILAPTEHSLSQPRRNSNSSASLISYNSDPLTAIPPSPSLANEFRYCQIVPSLKFPFQVRSVRKWLKDLRERRKENIRVQNAQIHAAVCVSAVAAAIAAVAAATASSAIDDGGTKTSIAVASAASLVAAHCVELAENMGAESHQVAAIVSSAVSVKTAGDVMTLTAAAATALRGASTLEARNSKETRKHATVAPYEMSRNYSDGLSLDIVISEDSETEFYNQELLAKGCEFLRRSKAGELKWRFVSIFLDKHGQVVIKLQSKHVGGALKKTEKSVIIDLYPEIPAWPGRNLLENGEQRRYFGIRTNRGVSEFECRSVYLHRLWTQGISHLLLLAHQQ